MKHKTSKLTLAIAFASGFSMGTAHAALEVENNDSIGSAQVVTADSTSGVISVSGYIGAPNTEPNGDLDFYRFFGQQGDVLTIDIDGGDGGQEPVNLMLTLFGSGPDYKVERMSITASSPDPGSDSTLDPRLMNVVLATSGDYTVAVSSFPRFLRDGGELVFDVPSVNGDYELIISGVTPPTPDVLNINIDIKPGSEIAPINLKSKGKIPAALLSSPDFNALTVDPDSLTFGATGDEQSLHKCNKVGEDVNGDGLLDLVCHFNNQATGFQAIDVEGTLKGQLKTKTAPGASSTPAKGEKIQGRGFLKTLPVSK